MNAERDRIAEATASLNLPQYFIVGNVGCPAGVPVLGATDPIADPNSTRATMAMASAAVACFGRGQGVGCQADRDGTFEHPRGRACDFMRSVGGHLPDAAEQANCTAMAEWAMANAQNLNILYIIWYDRVWSVHQDQPLPWTLWRPYGGKPDDVTDSHKDHVHISVKLMPDDPPGAHCPHSTCSE